MSEQNWQKATLQINTTKKGAKEIELTYLKKKKIKKQKIRNPNILKYRQELEKYHNQECEFLAEKNQILAIKIGEKTFPPKISNTPHPNNTKYQELFDWKNTRLPKDTKKHQPPIENYHLKLQKGVQWINQKFHFFHKEKILQPTFHTNHHLYEQAIQQYHQTLQSLEKINFQLAKQTFQPTWNLIAGLGHPSVYETSITLHHIYGFPYLPASSIKGVCRNWQILTKFQQNEKKALQDKEFVLIFGNQEKQGKILFFDAYPKQIANSILQVDVMNPHYSDYYTEPNHSPKTPPADYLDPTPIYFLTVTPNTPFDFFLALQPQENIQLLHTAQNILKEALTQQGIGAKTAIGYGIMQQHPDP